SPLATFAAALLGGGMALLLTARGAAARLATFAERAFSGRIDLTGALGELPSLVARMVLPVALAAFGAALVCGLAQSRGLFTLGAFGVRRRDPAEALPLVPWGLVAALAMAAALAARPLAAALARTDGTRAAMAAALSALS